MRYNKKIQKILDALSEAVYGKGYDEENVDVYFGAEVYLMFHSRHSSSPIGSAICSSKGIDFDRLQSAIDRSFRYACLCRE